MTTINLYQNQNEEEKRFTLFTGNKGFIFSIGIVVLTILILVGLKATIPFLEKRNQNSLAAVQKESDSLVGLNNVDLVVDMQTRLEHIKNNLQIKNGNVLRPELTKALSGLEKDSVAGVAVSKYEYAGDGAAVTFVAGNFSDIARQILNFKKSAYFTDVNVTNVGREEKGIVCTVEMGIKK